MTTSAAQKRRQSPEPFLWLLFSAGGMAAALLIPILLFLFGVAIPLGWLESPDHDHLSAVVHNPLTRLVLFGLCSLSLFHWAHRFRFTLEHGLQLARFDAMIAVCCYGTAAIGSAIAAYVLVSA